MKYLFTMCLFLTACSQLELEQAASFMKELEKSVVAQKGGASSSSNNNAATSAYTSRPSSSNSPTTTTTRAITTPYTAPTTVYSAQPNNTNSASNTSPSSSYGAGSSNSSSSSSNSGSRPVQAVPSAMGCVKVVRPTGKNWAEIYNTCSFAIEVNWCYAGTRDCKHGSWGATSMGTIRAGGNRSAGTFLSDAARYSLHYTACQGANTSAVETSPTTFYCRP